MKREPLTYETKDRRDYVPVTGLIGQVFEHAKGRRYRVTGFKWFADSDRWAIEYVEDGDPNAVSCVRTVDNFFGESKLGGPRFRQVA